MAPKIWDVSVNELHSSSPVTGNVCLDLILTLKSAVSPTAILLDSGSIARLARSGFTAKDILEIRERV